MARIRLQSTGNFYFVSTITEPAHNSLKHQVLRTSSHNIGICRHTPCFEQPLRHIASVAILCAPTPQLIRRGVVAFGESEPTSLQLKFSGRGGWSQRWFFAAPVRIALFARHCNFQVVVVDEDIV